MAKLDYQYISKLIDKAKDNDSNAYAELFAATYPSVYTFSCVFLENEKLAKETLDKTYVQAFTSLYQLQNNGIFVLWLLQINLRICLEYKPIHKNIQIDNHSYTINQLLKLPISESLTLVMRYYTHLRYYKIASIMDIPYHRVKDSIVKGKNRLIQLGG